MLYRHGDVLIKSVVGLPQGGEKRATSILVHGEATGHAHRIEDTTRGEIWVVNGEMFLNVLTETRIIHEEHQPITLPAGVYRVWQQREYTPQEIRYIRD